MWKSILKPEGSVIAGIAVVGVVYGLYQINTGTVSECHATDPNHPALESSRKKAGLQSLVLISGLTLITRDGNLGILGAGTIIAMELAYRHGIMAAPNSRTMVNPGGAAAYEPAENVTPFYAQGEPA